MRDSLREFTANHDDSITMAHLRVDDVAVGGGEYLARFKTKCVLQPLECGAVVLVDDRRNE